MNQYYLNIIYSKCEVYKLYYRSMPTHIGAISCELKYNKVRILL